MASVPETSPSTLILVESETVQGDYLVKLLKALVVHDLKLTRSLSDFC